MKNLASAALVVMVVSACSSSDAARPGPASEAGAQGGAGDGGCHESTCDGITYKGQSLATCCYSARGCGVVLDGQCVAPNVVRKLEPDAGQAPAFGTAETVVLDPGCPDQTFTMGAQVVLKGCCDKSGVCGSSTADLGAAIGFSIPAMCVTRSEAMQFGQRPAGDAGPEKTCHYPTEAGAPSDAGARD